MILWRMERPSDRPAEAVLHSYLNRAEVSASVSCACFHCFARFAPADIREWTDSDDPECHGVTCFDAVRYPGETALCPVCETDSVIGSASGCTLSDEFLRRLHDYWHGPKRQ